MHRLHDSLAGRKKKKDFTSFCQPTQPIACANHGNQKKKKKKKDFTSFCQPTQLVHVQKVHAAFA
jgi:hypothetical protein